MTRSGLTRLYAGLRAGGSSLRLRMTLAGVAALTLGICLTTLLLVQRAEHDTVRDQRAREEQETARTAAVLSARVVQLQVVLRVAGESLDEHTLYDGAALARSMESLAVLRSLFGHVVVATPEGKVRVYADRDGVHPPPFNVGGRPFFRRTMAEGVPVVSELLSSSEINEPIVVLTYPLRGPRGLMGVIAGSLRLGSGDLAAQAVRSLGPEDRDVLVVVSDAQGRILAHPEGNRVATSMADEPQLAAAWDAWRGLRSPHEPLGVSLELPGMVASVAEVSGPEWLVWRLLPQERLLQPLREARRHALTGAAVMVLATSLVLLVLVTRLLQPMHALQRRALSMFDPGQDPHAGWPAAGGEIGRLADVLREIGMERAQLEAANAELLGRLESVMVAAPVGIALTRHGRFELINAEFCRLFGREPWELCGHPMSLVGLVDTVQHPLLQFAEKALAVGHIYHGEWQMQRADGQQFWAVLRAQRTHPGDPSLGVIWTVMDHSEQVAARRQLEWNARHDALTRLANRSELERRVAQCLSKGAASQPSALVAIDLDRFKSVNDTAGHAAGDAMLQAVAEALRSCIRAADVAVRLGGDEFVLLLEHCPAQDALRIARAACAAIERIDLCWEGHRLHVGASAGVAMLEPGMPQAVHWLRAADQACYAAKRHGRGHVRLAGASAHAAQG